MEAEIAGKIKAMDPKAEGYGEKLKPILEAFAKRRKLKFEEVEKENGCLRYWLLFECLVSIIYRYCRDCHLIKPVIRCFYLWLFVGQGPSLSGVWVLRP